MIQDVEPAPNTIGPLIACFFGCYLKSAACRPPRADLQHKVRSWGTCLTAVEEWKKKLLALTQQLTVTATSATDNPTATEEAVIALPYQI